MFRSIWLAGLGGRAMLGAVALGAVLLAAAAAETVYVAAAGLDVKAKNKVVSKTLTTVRRGTALQVLERKGRWARVKVGDTEGWVPDTASVLSASKVGAGEPAVPLGDVGSRSNDLSNAAAARGLSEATRQFVNQNNLNPRPLEEMIRRGRDVWENEQLFESFTRALQDTRRRDDL